jgi:hypothetical protein
MPTEYNYQDVQQGIIDSTKSNQGYTAILNNSPG